MRGLLLTFPLLVACTSPAMRSTLPPERTFAEDVAFLRQHRETIVLVAPGGGGQIAVVPEFQGRVMTSSARGGAGRSYGFLKDELIASRERSKGINVYGGEDRFWIGPEGGQFSVFFAPGTKEQTLANWQTPALIDTESYPLVEQSASAVRFARPARLVNASGTVFDFAIDRTIEVLDASVALAELGAEAEGLAAVAYESRNTLTNTGANQWTKERGLLSIWILGMFKPAPRTTVILPLTLAHGTELTGRVNDAYFGKVPPERLKHVASAHGSALLFRGDGALRGKIGASPGAARPLAASWDPERGVLTVVAFTLPAGARDYVNSTWVVPQAEPFRGDAVNSYNDGPSAPGAAPFGPFYELESSSPAAELAPGQSLTHVHRTLHLEGPRAALDRVARALLGLSLGEIESGL
jgi:hypothetical protein